MASSEDYFVEISRFHQNDINNLIIGLVASILVMLSLLGWVLYQVSHRPLPVYVASRPDNKTMELAVFNEPNYLPSTLIRWASKAAVAAYTFDFVNYNKEISLARPYFTDAGWSDYKNSLGGLINAIAQKQLFVNSVVSGAPIISNQGELFGKGYTWRMQLPFLVTYQTSETASRQNFIVVMTIVKVSTNIDPRGIGIDQFVMR